MWIAVLMVQAAAQSARAQETTTSPSQSTSAPAPEEKQRSDKETKKRLEQLACGPPHVHFLHQTAKEPQALPEQPPDKGLIYVIRPHTFMTGEGAQAKLAMDGKWVGVNRPGNYFYFEVDPGPHYFCMQTGGHGLLSLVIEKGKTYYLRQSFIFMGDMELNLLDAGEGKSYVPKLHRSIFEEKPKK